MIDADLLERWRAMPDGVLWAMRDIFVGQQKALEDGKTIMVGSPVRPIKGEKAITYVKEGIAEIDKILTDRVKKEVH